MDQGQAETGLEPYIIRDARSDDRSVIGCLLAELGYPDSEAFLEERIERLQGHPDHRLVVATAAGRVVGLLSLHFLPQLAVARDFCRIAYLCVADGDRGCGVGGALEAWAVDLAGRRGCDRIELHCHARRQAAHRFYERCGYFESPRYYVKSIVESACSR